MNVDKKQILQVEDSASFDGHVRENLKSGTLANGIVGYCVRESTTVKNLENNSLFDDTIDMRPLKAGCYDEEIYKSSYHSICFPIFAMIRSNILKVPPVSERTSTILATVPMVEGEKPVCNRSVIAVMQLLLIPNSISERDCDELIKLFSVSSSVSLRHAQLYRRARDESKWNKVLLDLAKDIFKKVDSMEACCSRIIHHGNPVSYSFLLGSYAI